ncbi:hypothetical protein KW782_02590 [Candidatus Parcubacteria bacterium]|nr:hypothetical protein [Candidatus Parcubacteria bacterium]
MNHRNAADMEVEVTVLIPRPRRERIEELRQFYTSTIQGETNPRRAVNALKNYWFFNLSSGLTEPTEFDRLVEQILDKVLSTDGPVDQNITMALDALLIRSQER